MYTYLSALYLESVFPKRNRKSYQDSDRKLELWIDTKKFSSDYEMNQLALFYLLSNNLEFEISFTTMQMQKALFNRNKIKEFTILKLIDQQTGETIKLYNKSEDENHFILP